jgi:predicted transcriptional regulator of viral defense system
MKITNVRSLSAREVELLSMLEFEGKEVYSREEIISFCGNEEAAVYLIKRLLDKKRLRSIARNIYFPIPMKAPDVQWGGNEYLIAKALVREAEYYIGYSAVFNFYGFTDQVPQVIHVVNTRYSIVKKVFGIAYTLKKVLPNRLYGLEKRAIRGEEVVFPTKERALIDVFGFYNTGQARDMLSEQLRGIDVPLFVSYVNQYPVQIIRRRIGYFLEQLGIGRNLLKQINIGKTGYSPLYGSRSSKGTTSKRWRLILNG